MKTSDPNFIIIKLCDNDFGCPLEEAARIVFRALYTHYSEEIFRLHMVSMTNALSRLQHPTMEHSSLDYLFDKIKVTYSDTSPQGDDDGGSVAIDVNRNYIWRF